MNVNKTLNADSQRVGAEHRVVASQRAQPLALRTGARLQRAARPRVCMGVRHVDGTAGSVRRPARTTATRSCT